MRFLADEDFNNDILRGLLRRSPDLDIVRVQDVNLSGADDPTVLERAAREGRVLLTHDVSTVTKHAFHRVLSGLAMPGVFEANDNASMKTLIDDILLLAECSLPDEWEGQVRYLPLR